MNIQNIGKYFQNVLCEKVRCLRMRTDVHRRDKTNYYLDLAETVSQRCTCLRRHYGAVIVKNNEIISFAPTRMDLENNMLSEMNQRKILICGT